MLAHLVYPNVLLSAPQALTLCGTGTLGKNGKGTGKDKNGKFNGDCTAEWTVLPLIMVHDDMMMTGSALLFDPPPCLLIGVALIRILVARRALVRAVVLLLPPAPGRLLLFWFWTWCVLPFILFLLLCVPVLPLSHPLLHSRPPAARPIYRLCFPLTLVNHLQCVYPISSRSVSASLQRHDLCSGSL